MGGHAFGFAEDFHGVVVESDLHGLTYQTVRHGVIVAGQFDVVIRVDLGAFPLGKAVGFMR